MAPVDRQPLLAAAALLLAAVAATVTAASAAAPYSQCGSNFALEHTGCDLRLPPGQLLPCMNVSQACQSSARSSPPWGDAMAFSCAAPLMSAHSRETTPGLVPVRGRPHRACACVQGTR